MSRTLRRTKTDTKTSADGTARRSCDCPRCLNDRTYSTAKRQEAADSTWEDLPMELVSC